jgi:hypothetical protein
MVYVLIWMQLLTTSQQVDYYHIETYDTQAECVAGLSKASVLVSNKSETVACLELKVE